MNINTMTYGELQEHIEESIRLLRLEAYGQGYEQGRFDQRMDDSLDDDFDEVKEDHGIETRQERRDEIVAKAKADIDGLKTEGQYEVRGEYAWVYVCDAEFVVNKEKRTVVALLKGLWSRIVYAKGIAKCHPDECFNVHIGKAIALRRALGWKVPEEYLNAPQPTEARVGDEVKSIHDEFTEWGNGVVVRIEKPGSLRGYWVKDGSYMPLKYAKIIDDSREETNDD